MTSCRLQSNYSSSAPRMHGGPVVLRPVRATPCLMQYNGSPAFNNYRWWTLQARPLTPSAKNLVTGDGVLINHNSLIRILLGGIAFNDSIDAAYCDGWHTCVVCVSVCLSRSWALQRTAERIRRRLGATRVGPRNHVLDGAQITLYEGAI